MKTRYLRVFNINNLLVLLLALMLIVLEAACAKKPVQISKTGIQWLSMPDGMLSERKTERRWNLYKKASECLQIFDETFVKGKAFQIALLDKETFRTLKTSRVFPETQSNLSCDTMDPGLRVKPIVTVMLNEEYGERQMSVDEAIAWFYSATSIARHGDRGIRIELTKSLADWAQADALKSGIHVSWNPKPVDYQIIVLIGVLVTAFSEVQADLSASERMLVGEWLNRLVQEVGNSHWADRQDNKEYQKVLIGLIWALTVEDFEAVHYATDIYKQAIHDMRPDGSFPMDSQRGGMGLHYNNYSAGNLFSIAALLKTSKGIDLFSYSVDGRSIHTAIEFVIHSIENPALNQKYAISCPHSGDRFGTVENPSMYFSLRDGERFLAAYLLVYASFFPDSANAERIRNLYGKPWNYPAFSETLTGNVPCLFNLKNGSKLLTATNEASPLSLEQKNEKSDPDYNHSIETTKKLVKMGRVDRGKGYLWREVRVNMRLDEKSMPDHFSFALNVNFWGGHTEDAPNLVALVFDHHMLPSIDLSKMKECGGYRWLAQEKKGRRRLTLPFNDQQSASQCMYNSLDERDQKVVRYLVDQIEEIVTKGTKGQSDAAYWKGITTIIKSGASIVVGQ